MDNVHPLFAGVLQAIRPNGEITIRRHPVGISDEQTEREHRAAARLWKAIIEMELAIDEVNTLSCLVEVSGQAFQDFVHDEIPSRQGWAEKINAARRGYEIGGLK